MLIFKRFFFKVIKLNNWFLFLFSVLFIYLSSELIYRLEPNNFKNLFNAFWWVMTTVTTVGYGDFYPHTVAGKWVAMFLYFFGISLIGVIFSKIVDTFFVFKKNKEEGKLKYKGEQHFVIIGWNKNAALAIEEILHTNTEKEIVLIDVLEKTPIEHMRVHYVQGNPTRKTTLEQANVNQAKAVFVFANHFTENNRIIMDTSFIDGKMLLISSTVKKHYPHVYIVVEVMEEENIHNFELVEVDEYILAEEMVSKLAVRSAFNPGASGIFTQLLSSQHGEDLFEIIKRPEWHTYQDAFHALLQQGATLISDGTRLDINRRLHESIPDEARLFVICNKQTIDQLK